MSQQTTSNETIHLNGRNLVEVVKELLHEGNIRRIVVKDAGGNVVSDVPVTVGVVGLLAAPKLAALGAVAALATDHSLEIEREDAGGAESTSAREVEQ